MTDTPTTETTTPKKRRPRIAFKTQLQSAATTGVAPNAALHSPRMTHNARAWARKKGYAVAKGKNYFLTEAGARFLGWTDTPKPRQGFLRRAVNAVRNLFA